MRPQLIAGKSTALNGALLIEGREPILFCSGGERDRVDRTMPWIKEAHTIPIVEEKALVEGLVRDILGPVLKKHGLAGGKLGLDEANTVFTKALAAHFPKLQVEDGDTPMQAARRTKLPRKLSFSKRRRRSPTPSRLPRQRRSRTACGSAKSRARR